MIERVAAALTAERDRIVAADVPPSEEIIGRLLARAAITAMREPTEAMLNASPFDLAEDWRRFIGEALK